MSPTAELDQVDTWNPDLAPAAGRASTEWLTEMEAQARLELAATVTRLHREGMSDADIGLVMDRSPAAVRKIRAKEAKRAAAATTDAADAADPVSPGKAPAPVRTHSHPAQIRRTAEQVAAEVVFHRCFGRDPQHLEQARTIAAEVVARLQHEGVIKHCRALNRSKMLDDLEANPDSEKPARGISHLVALSLVLLRLNVVGRDTVRAMIPPLGVPEATVDVQFNRALRQFAVQDWITEDEQADTVKVRHPDYLARWYQVGVDPTNRHAAAALRLARAVERTNASMDGLPPDDAHAERRRHELIALHRIMQSEPSHGAALVGSPRLVASSNGPL